MFLNSLNDVKKKCPHEMVAILCSRVHFAFWHKLVYNFKITSSVFKKS